MLINAFSFFRSQKSDSFAATSDDPEDRLSVHSSVLSSEGWQCFQVGLSKVVSAERP